MLKKKLLVLNAAVVIGFGSSIAIPVVNAESVNELQNKQTQIQNERSEVKNSISEAEKEIGQAEAELIKLNEQINRVDQAVEDNQNKMDDTKSKITETKKQVNELENEIETLEENIEQRFEILKDRAASFQKSGGKLNYLDVILGSKSFGDFISRVSAVSKIAEADTDLLEKHEADKKEVEEKRTSVEKKLTNLNDMKTELEGMQAQILEQKEQNDVLKEELNNKIDGNKELKAALESKDSNLASKESEIKQNIETKESSQSQIETLSEENTRGSSESSNSVTHQADVNKVSAPKPSGNISDAISAGYKYIGNSVYVFGGGRTAYDIANGRFDCSGFVHWAYAQAGISVGASTSVLSGTGTKVSTSEMRPGDMVFFNTYKTNGHVGIYVGGGKFIGSQSSTGVAVANMSSGYWKEHFSGHVRRVN